METDSTAELAPAPASGVAGRSRAWRILAWGGLFLLLGILALGLRRSQQGPVAPGQSAPGFTLTTFGGEDISSQDLEGKVIVVNFWASWCKPCEQEAADLETAWKQYAPGGQVVFLGVDYVDTEPEAMAYLNRFAITYPNGPDLGTRISQSFRMQGVPETYVIDQDGTLTYVKKGPFNSLAEIRLAIDPLLEP
ncbi:MAG TPA: TlpA disulfide reductase family protein [Anaerolineales bacterium]|jgi:cytochrome c biogenesis protein CcmG/thiol:disulfide interchange protein DsbE|nr:TlpA disulfide reductase family protein [Anaerolineales bacterium]